MIRLRHRPIAAWLAATLLLLLTVAGCSSDPKRVGKRVMILGVDGMDPVLLQQFVDEGVLPNFSKLIAEGDFKPLQTTMPPLSPVAWSTFLTGMDPGGHAIFDFIDRDPKTMLPSYSMTRTTPSDWTIELGDWVIPLSGGAIEPLRRGRTFWEELEERGVPSTLYKIPANFPPVQAGHSLSGMGTPDLLGSQGGTFTLFTNRVPPDSESFTGGRVFEVEVYDDIMLGRLYGPPNPLRKEEPAGFSATPSGMAADFEVYIDPQEPVARIDISGSSVVLQQGEWSDWVTVQFDALPYVMSVTTTVRFYLQEARPDFKLYVSPMQIDPANPAMPISYPESWSADLQHELGHFYTQELPEDTKALTYNVFTGAEFWQQVQSVYQESRHALDYFLGNFDDGLLFFYFSSVDQGCHMLWRYMDETHPAHIQDELLQGAIRTLYRQMDDALGQIMESIDDETTLIVMSDHGFAPFNRGVNLNTWLVDTGYARLKNPARRDDTAFLNVDWSRTRAYAAGLNGLYVNLRGREANGIVSQGREYQALLDRLEGDLLEFRDPVNGEPVVTRVVQTSRDFADRQLNDGPDIIVGYNRGYRSSWANPLGEFPPEVLEDNLDAWSGDHGMDDRFVPGVLISNRKITLENPALYDLTVAVLDEFGVAAPPQMIGKDCLGPKSDR